MPRPVAARRRSRERLAWALVAVLGLVAAGQLGLRFTQPAPIQPGSVRFDLEAPRGVTSFGSPRISPDGKYIAFNAQDSTGLAMIWIRPLNALESYRLAGTEGCIRPFWSADSRFVGFFANGKLKRIPVAGGPPLTVCEFGPGADGCWGATGSILFDGRSGDSIQVVSAGGGIPAGATTIDRSRGETGHGWPFFLPDGKRFLYIAFRTNDPDEIRLAELGTTKTTFLTEGNSRVEYVEPGYLIFERSGTLLAQPFDVGAGKLSGDPFPLTEGIGTGDVGLAHFSGSRTGTLIFTGGDESVRQLEWMDRQGRVLEPVGLPSQCFDPALSADQRSVVLEVVDPQKEGSDLWIIDLKRQVPTRLTFDPSWDYSPMWSPDGSRVVFTSDRDREGGVYVKNSSGTTPEVKLISSEGRLLVNDWSRDGRTILAQLRRPNSIWDIVSFDATGNGTIQDQIATPFIELNSRFSPNGKFFAYQSNESGRSEIYLATFPAGGGKWRISDDGAREPFWREDGRELYYLSLDHHIMAVDVSLGATVEIGTPRRLFAAPTPRSGNDRNRYVPSPDGQRFLVVALPESQKVAPTTVVLNWAAELKNR